MSLQSYDPQSISSAPEWDLLRASIGNQDLMRLRNEAIRTLAPLMSADIIESEKDYKVHVDLPGAENMDISLDNGMLSISADRKVMHEVSSDVVHKIERSYGKVRRNLVIPSDADADKAAARYIDGVLTVTIPKKEGSKRARIEIS